MRNWLVSILFLFTLPVFAQTAAFNGFCTQGGVSALTQGLNSTNKLQGIVPSCTVTVYLTGTTNLATIYADANSTPLSNPFTANAISSVAPGKWLFFAATGTGYDVVMSGGISPNVYSQPVTLTDVQVGSGGGGTGCVPSGAAGTLQADNGSGGCESVPGDYGATDAGTFTFTPTNDFNVTNSATGDFNISLDGGQASFSVGNGFNIADSSTTGIDLTTLGDADISANNFNFTATGAIDISSGSTYAITAATDLSFFASTASFYADMYFPEIAAGSCDKALALDSSGKAITVACSSGGITGSGTTGYYPLWTGTTALGNGHLDDGITTANTITSSEGLAVAVSGGAGGSFDATEGTAARMTAGHDVLYADSTNHCMEYSANGGSFDCLPSLNGGQTFTGANIFTGSVNMTTGSFGVNAVAFTVNGSTLFNIAGAAQFQMAPSGTATSSLNKDSTNLDIQCGYWNGSAAQRCGFYTNAIPASGSNPLVTLTHIFVPIDTTTPDGTATGAESFEYPVTMQDLTVTGTCTGCGGGISYPGAGVANSTGSAWGASYSVNGSGVGLVSGPASSTDGDVTTFTGAAGQIADSGILLSSLAPLTSVVQLNPPTTAANTIAPTSTSVVPLTVNTPTGSTADLQDWGAAGSPKSAFIDQYGTLNLREVESSTSLTLSGNSGNVNVRAGPTVKIYDFDVFSGWTGSATAGTVVAVSNAATHAVAACATSCTNAFAVVNSNPASNAYIQTIGSASVALDGTYTVTGGEYVCTSVTTAGEGTPQSSQCSTQQIGFVTTPATSVTSATVFLDFQSAGGSGGSGTVTSIATTSPITGGTITTTGTIACATCVVASSPGTGIAHFAGSTQTVTSSAVNLASSDVTGLLPNANLATQTANTVLGALTATTPSGLAMPSCSTSTSALEWTSGTGFGCHTIAGMTYPSGSGVPIVSSGSSWGTTVAAPSGTIVGTTDTQTLTNKTVDGVTPTIFGYLDATSSIQTQLNAKAALASPTFTGTPAAPTATSGTNTNQIATTAFVQTALTTGIPLSCQPGIGDGLNAIPAGTYLTTTCRNETGQTWTITAIRCVADSGSSTCNVTNGAGTGLLTGAITGTSTYANGTQSGTTTIASGDYLKITFVADGTSKQIGIDVAGTY